LSTASLEGLEPDVLRELVVEVFEWLWCSVTGSSEGESSDSASTSVCY